MIYHHDASLRDRATLASPQAPAGLGHPESIPSADFTAEDFLAWARTRPVGEAYSYGDTKGCALCIYFHDRGIGFRFVGGTHWLGPDGSVHAIPDDLSDALVEAWPRTMGGLVRQIEEKLAK